VYCIQELDTGKKPTPDCPAENSLAAVDFLGFNTPGR